MAKINKISGFPEWLPEQKIAEDKVIAIIKRIYESHGFAPIETPAVELLTTLGSKGVIDKEIFVVKRLKAEADDEAELGLHFDLTVPLARYVAQHAHALSFPFRRYQLQKVWRGDRPQKGRFREFYQFDIDIIARNELPLSCDAEVVGVIGLVMQELNVGPYSLRINSRKLLSALYGAVGVEGEGRKSAIIAVDKILKIGRDGVARELSQIPGISQEAIEKILESTSVQCPIAELASRIASLQLGGSLVDEGVQELATICSLLPAEMSHLVTIDLSLARGLDYYTGLILEVGLVNHPEFGTVVAGGRYDNLTSEFTDQKFPGVGVSIGLGRLMDLLVSEKLVPTQQRCPSQVLVTVYNEQDRVSCNQVAHELRRLGFPTEVYYKAPKLGKQIEYAEEKGIRYVLFLDSTTRAMKIKDLITKEQVEIASLADWVASL